MTHLATDGGLLLGLVIGVISGMRQCPRRSMHLASTPLILAAAVLGSLHRTSKIVRLYVEFVADRSYADLKDRA